MTALPPLPPATEDGDSTDAASLLREATARLEAAGVESPAWDAESLLRHVLAWDRATFLTRLRVGVDSDRARRFGDLVRQRSARVPLQHLTGTQAFWRHDFLVTRDVLIPRPETELLVELSLARLRDIARPVIVDVGTGSGCIALSLAGELPAAELHATDISEPALAVARENARRLGMQDRVSFYLGDLLAPLASMAGAVNLVVSNPPYVEAKDRASLAPEVRDHEPATALFASEPPARVYERLAVGAAGVLRIGGRLLVEIGLEREAAVSDAIERAGLAVIETHPDLRGITRAVGAVRER